MSMRIKSRKADQQGVVELSFVEHRLIELYLLVCKAYDNQPCLKYQRLSNFKPRCTDQELLTMYLFGHFQGFSQQRRIYQYVRQHWQQWFPTLPSYQAFNRRLNLLVASFEHIIGKTLSAGVEQLAHGSDRLIDSMPVMLAKGTRSTGRRTFDKADGWGGNHA